jgi:hypothetical protein
MLFVDSMSCYVELLYLLCMMCIACAVSMKLKIYDDQYNIEGYVYKMVGGPQIYMYVARQDYDYK